MMSERNKNFLSFLCNLENKKVILASESPRRKELLKSVGLNFEVLPAEIEEKYESKFSPIEYVQQNSKKKAQLIANQNHSYDLIIAADTVVTFHGQIFEKPTNSEQAFEMLKKLNGKTHQVITGFCLSTHHQEITEFEETQVTFYPLSDLEIKKYLESDEPFDKAGAYGIQGYAALFVRKVEGCYFNVVGFPLAKFYQRLKELNF